MHTKSAADNEDLQRGGAPSVSLLQRMVHGWDFVNGSGFIDVYTGIQPRLYITRERDFGGLLAPKHLIEGWLIDDRRRRVSQRKMVF